MTCDERRVEYVLKPMKASKLALGECIVGRAEEHRCRTTADSGTDCRKTRATPVLCARREKYDRIFWGTDLFKGGPKFLNARCSGGLVLEKNTVRGTNVCGGQFFL